MQVRETISHGTYRNVRVVDLEDTRPSNVARMVRDCGYVVQTERVIGPLALALESGGSYSHGWVDWEVVK